MRTTRVGLPRKRKARTRPRFVSLIARMRITPGKLLRDKGTPFDELGLSTPDLSDDQLVDAMIEHPILINGPSSCLPSA